MINVETVNECENNSLFSKAYYYSNSIYHIELRNFSTKKWYYYYYY